MLAVVVDGGARVPGAAAMEKLLRRRIKVFPVVDGGSGVFHGEAFVRSVHLPFGFAGDLMLLLPSDFGQATEAMANLPRLLFLLLAVAVGGVAEWSFWGVRVLGCSLSSLILELGLLSPFLRFWSCAWALRGK